MTDLNGLSETLGTTSMAYLERLEKMEERFVKQQKEHTRSILKAIETTHASIESKLASWSAGHAPRVVSLGLRGSASQSVRSAKQFGKIRSELPGNNGECSLQLMPLKSDNPFKRLHLIPYSLAQKLSSKTNSELSNAVSATRSCGEKAVRCESTMVLTTPTTQTVAPQVKLDPSKSFSLDFDDMDEPPPSKEQADLPTPSVEGSNPPHALPGLHAAPVAASQSNDQRNGDRIVKHKAQCCSRFTLRQLDLFIAFVIFLNMFLIFIQVEVFSVDIASQLGMITDLDPHQSDARLLVFDFLQHAFNAIFALEVLTRIAVDRLTFFRSVVNRLDALIVLWSLFSQYTLQQVSSQPLNLSYLRLLRACKVVWTLRVVRTSNMFENLRILMCTIITSTSTLLWSLTALAMVMVITSVYLSQSLTSFLLDPTENRENQKRVFDLYGSSSRSFCTLFLVTFSDRWQSYVELLANHVSAVYSFFFSVYIVFVRFGMLHVIVALIVKDAIRVAEYDSHMMHRKKMEKKKNLISLLEAHDKSGMGQFSLDELRVALADPQTKNILLSLGMDIHELDLLFDLLKDEDGHVDCHELADNIMYIQGQYCTKSILHVCKSILETCRQVERKMEVPSCPTLSSVNKAQSALPSNVTRSELCPKCQAAEKAKKRKRLMVKLKIFLVLLKQKTTRLGHTLLCHSYQDYLFYRGHLKDEHYKIELRSDHEEWAEMFKFYKEALLALPSGHRLNNIYWIGSSAVPGLVAKPVLDIMITTSEEDLKDIVRAICMEAATEPWMSKHGKGLRFPIGFYMEGWGFLQMPHYQAHTHGLLECNVHIFHAGTKAANDKIILVEYLKSQAGEEYKQKYSILKLSLELRYTHGQLDSANYNKEKHFLVAQIVEAAAAWDAVRSPKSARGHQTAAATGKHGEALNTHVKL